MGNKKKVAVKVVKEAALPIKPLSWTRNHNRSSVWHDFPESNTIERARWKKADTKNAPPGVGTLDVIFRSGAGYRYYRITKTEWWALCASPSAGEYINRYVKPNATRVRRFQ